MSSDYARALGVRLRQIRAQQGMSLHEVEKRSRGRWKAVVVGSYERGDRAISVHKLADLADFYGVPVSQLLPGRSDPATVNAPTRVVVDLVRLAELDQPSAAPLHRYVATIQALRGDYNGKVLSIRQDDLRSLAIVYDETPPALVERLVAWELVDPEARSALNDDPSASGEDGNSDDDD